MDHRHSFVLGALVAAAGFAVGAITVTAAVPTIAFSGVNPNNGHPGVRAIGIEGTVEQRNNIVRDRQTSGLSRMVKKLTETYRRAHGAARTQQSKTQPTVDVGDKSHCEGLSGPRLARCGYEADQGRKYRPRQTDLPTEE